MLLTPKQTVWIRKQAQEMEQSRELSAQILQLIYEQKLFKLFLPNELGGRMTPFPEALRIFQACSRIDGSFGWLVTIGSGGGLFAPLMQAEISKKIFLDPKAVIAGSGAPTGLAEKVAGGFRVSGNWKYCSGSTYATVFTANAIVSEVDELRTFIFQPEQLKLRKDWRAFGLQATASHSIVAEKVYVPAEMTFLFTENQAYQQEPVYQYPFLPFSTASFAVVCLGIAQHFMEAAQELVHQHRDSWDAKAPGRVISVQQQIIEQTRRLEASEQDFYQTIDSSWQQLLTKHQLSKSTQEHVVTQSKLLAHTANVCAQKIFPILGLSAAMVDSKLNQTWRDLLTACQHIFLQQW